MGREKGPGGQKRKGGMIENGKNDGKNAEDKKQVQKTSRGEREGLIVQIMDKTKMDDGL